MYHVFKVNGELIAANNIDEAISIYREAEPREKVTSASEVMGGGYSEYIHVKLPTEEDIKHTFGE